MWHPQLSIPEPLDVSCASTVQSLLHQCDKDNDYQGVLDLFNARSREYSFMHYSTSLKIITRHVTNQRVRGSYHTRRLLESAVERITRVKHAPPSNSPPSLQRRQLSNIVKYVSRFNSPREMKSFAKLLHYVDETALLHYDDDACNTEEFVSPLYAYSRYGYRGERYLKLFEHRSAWFVEQCVELRDWESIKVASVALSKLGLEAVPFHEKVGEYKEAFEEGDYVEYASYVLSTKNADISDCSSDVVRSMVQVGTLQELCAIGEAAISSSRGRKELFFDALVLEEGIKEAITASRSEHVLHLVWCLSKHLETGGGREMMGEVLDLLSFSWNTFWESPRRAREEVETRRLREEEETRRLREIRAMAEENVSGVLQVRPSEANCAATEDCYG